MLLSCSLRATFSNGVTTGWASKSYLYSNQPRRTSKCTNILTHEPTSTLAPLWSRHRHHHVFSNPSLFAVIADDYLDQCVRAAPMLVLPALFPINMAYFKLQINTLTPTHLALRARVREVRLCGDGRCPSVGPLMSGRMSSARGARAHQRAARHASRRGACFIALEAGCKGRGQG